jgi:hypothetical protein
MLIYKFSTEAMGLPGNEKRCNMAPYVAHHCTRVAVIAVSMSNSNTASKLYAISSG